MVHLAISGIILFVGATVICWYRSAMMLDHPTMRKTALHNKELSNPKMLIRAKVQKP